MAPQMDQVLQVLQVLQVVVLADPRVVVALPQGVVDDESLVVEAVVVPEDHHPPDIVVVFVVVVVAVVVPQKGHSEPELPKEKAVADRTFPIYKILNRPFLQQLPKPSTKTQGISLLCYRLSGLRVSLPASTLS